MKKFYAFTPKNLRIFSKMKSFMAVALLMLVAVGNLVAQDPIVSAVVAGGHGTVAPTTDAARPYTFTVTPDNCYHVATIAVDGTPYDLANIATTYEKNILFEDFNSFTDVGTGNAQCQEYNTAVATTPAGYANWIFTKAYPAGGKLKMGSGTAAGSLSVSNLDLSAGNYKVYFDARYRYSTKEKQTIYVEVNGTRIADGYTLSSVSASDCTMFPEMVEGTNGTANSTLKISAMQSSDNRYFIDNLRVAVDVAIDGSQFFTLENVTADADVVVTFALNQYQMSHTTNGNGTVNGTAAFDALVDCHTDFAYQMQAATGYHIANYIFDGSEITVDNSTAYVSTFELPVADVVAAHNLTANFAINTYTLTANAIGNGTVTPTTTTVDYDGTATFTATATEGYHITAITKNGVVTTYTNDDNVTTEVITYENVIADDNLTVEFAINQYEVATEVLAGNGEFTPATQLVNYNETAEVTVTADVANGYHITSITYGGNTTTYTNEDHKVTETITLNNVTANDTIRATFELDQFLISVVNNGNGVIDPANDTYIIYGNDANFGIKSEPCYFINEILVDGTPATITDPNSDGYTFSNVTAPHTIEVSFEIYNYAMKSAANGEGTVSNSTENCGSDYTYEIRANEGNHIVSYTLDGVETIVDNSEAYITSLDVLVENIQNEHLLVAEFAINTYTLYTLVEAGQGTIAPTAIMVDYGTDTAFTVTADVANHYTITSFTQYGVQTTYTVEDEKTAISVPYHVTGNDTLKVTFALPLHTITVINNGNGTITPANDTTLLYGQDVQFAVTPDPCYFISEIKVENVAITAPYDITGDNILVTNESSIEVTFDIYTYEMNAVADANGTISTTVADCGSNYTYEIRANEGYHIAEIFDNGVSVMTFTDQPNSYDYEVTDIQAAHELQVTFAINTYDVVMIANGNGSITCDTANLTNLAHGTTLTFTFTANNDCNELTAVAINGVDKMSEVVGNQLVWNATEGGEIVATFSTIQYEMEMVVYDMASMSSISQSFDTIDCGSDYTYNMVAPEGYHIDYYTIDTVMNTLGDNSHVAATYDLTNVQSNKSMFVGVSLNTYNVTLCTAVGGTLTTVSPLVLHGHDCYVEVNADTENGYHIATITTGDSTTIYGNNTDVAATFIINNVVSDTTICATFALNQYSITATLSDEENATINILGENVVTYGDTVTYTVKTTNDCYLIASVNIDGTDIDVLDTIYTYTFEDVKANHTIEATIQHREAFVSVHVNETERGDVVLGAPQALCGEPLTYEVVPTVGNHIVQIVVDRWDNEFNLVSDTLEIADSSYYAGEIVAASNDVMYEIYANFAINHYEMIATAGEHGTILIEGTQVVEHGTDLSYIISPDACYYISEIMVDGEPLTAFDETLYQYDFDAISESHTIHADFAIYQYAMTETHTGEGIITTEAAQNCGTDYDYVITAETGWHIESYTIGTTTVTNTFAEPNDFTTATETVYGVSQDTNINVVFAINTYTVSTCDDTDLNGTLVVNAPVEVNYNEATTVTVTADAANGYHIVSISDNRGNTIQLGANTDITYEYQVENVTEDVEVCAVFALNSFNITAEPGTNGTITPAGTTTIVYGDTLTYTVEPSTDCYYISNVTVDGSQVWVAGTDSIAPYIYTFIAADFNQAIADHTIASEYTIFNYQMTSAAFTEGTVSAATVDCGTNYDYEIAANYGYHIDRVVLDGVTTNYAGQQTTDVITIVDVHADHHIDVYFAINHYTVTTMAHEHGAIETAGTVTVAHGDAVTYTITPDACYYISDIQVNGVSTNVTDITGQEFTIASVEDTTTIEAFFSIYVYNMTANIQGQGTVTEGTADCGSNYIYTATAAAGWHIASLRVGNLTHSHYGQNQDVTATFQVNGVSQDTICYAVFEKNMYDIDVTVAGAGTVTPGDTTVAHGENVTYTVTPDAGHYIATVVVDGVEVAQNEDSYTYSFNNITADHTFAVTFERIAYTITATAGANGDIMMPGENVVLYGDDIYFTIRAINDCYHISNILVDGNEVISFTNNESYYQYTFNHVDANHTIVANFEQNTYTVTATAGANGTIAPAGTATLNCGDNATYTFTPDAGYAIANVTVNGEDLGVMESYTITDIHDNYTINVEFERIAYVLTATAYGEGTVTPAGTTTVNEGATQTFTFQPAACNTISELLVNGVSYLENAAFDGTTLTLSNIEADMNVQVYYQVETYTITSSVTGNGTITEGGVYNCGSDVTFIITPNACNTLDKVLVNGTEVTVTNNTYTFTALDADATIEAIFTADEHTVTASVNDDAMGTITATATYACGATPTYVITPNEGYHIVNVIVNGNDQGEISSYTFAPLTADATIEAIFAINTYTITAAANAGVTMTPDAGETTVDFGSSVTYTFTVEDCYEILDVFVDGVGVGAVTTYTFDNVDADHNLVVSTAVKTYTITATTNDGGSISPAGVTIVNCDATQSYTIAAAAGYYVEDVLVDGASVGVVNNYVFSSVVANHTIEVVFAAFDSLTYTITATAGANGAITPAGTTTVNFGESVTYVITPDQYYAIAQVVVDGNVLPAPVATYTFVNVTENHTIDVTFVADTVSCLAPSLAWTTDITSTSATFNWSDMDATSYTIRYKKYDEDTYTIVTGITATSYVVNGLAEATQYVWNVKSVCVDGEAESNWSAQVNFITVDEYDPTNLDEYANAEMNVYSYGSDIYVNNLSQERIQNVQVFDMNGRMVYNGQAQENPQVIRVQSANGLYVVRVVTDTQVRNYKVIISQR